MDIDQIKALVELMVEHDLSRIEWQNGDQRLLLRRGQPAPAAAPFVTYTSAPPAAMIPGGLSALPGGNPLAALAPAGVSSAPVAAPPESPAETLIRSPMVGTFYASPDPNSPPFVSAGDVVTPERVVCLIEAMKVFNEIKAETAGLVARVLVKNGQAVEYDQPLFAVVPA